MEQVLFGDIFGVIEKHLFPINLHNLSLLCQKYSKMITKDIIKKNAVSVIKNRLRCNFGNNYDEFVEIMKKINGVIIGHFIYRCLLGEKCDHVNICTKEQIIIRDDINSDEETNDQKNSETIKFMVEKGYVTKKRILVGYDNHQRRIRVNVTSCDTNEIRTSIYSIHDLDKISINDFVHKHSEYDVTKNMYSFVTDEIYIDKMEEIFAKVTNVARFSTLQPDFANMYKQGFRFYKPKTNKKLMSNDDILHSFYNVMKVQEREVGKSYDTGRYVIENRTIYRRKHHTPIFDIIKTSFYDGRDESARDNFYMNKCTTPEKCNIKLLYPDIIHYHGRYIDCSESQSELSSVDDGIDNSVILMVI